MPRKQKSSDAIESARIGYAGQIRVAWIGAAAIIVAALVTAVIDRVGGKSDSGAVTVQGNLNGDIVLGNKTVQGIGDGKVRSFQVRGRLEYSSAWEANALPVAREFHDGFQVVFQDFRDQRYIPVSSGTLRSLGIRDGILAIEFVAEALPGDAPGGWPLKNLAFLKSAGIQVPEMAFLGFADVTRPVMMTEATLESLTLDMFVNGIHARRFEKKAKIRYDLTTAKGAIAVIVNFHDTFWSEALKSLAPEG